MAFARASEAGHLVTSRSEPMPVVGATVFHHFKQYGVCIEHDHILTATSMFVPLLMFLATIVSTVTCGLIIQPQRTLLSSSRSNGL